MTQMASVDASPGDVKTTFSHADFGSKRHLPSSWGRSWQEKEGEPSSSLGLWVILLFWDDSRILTPSVPVTLSLCSPRVTLSRKTAVHVDQG